MQQLPEPFQAEVLHFVEYLLTRTGSRAEDLDWSALSLRNAARGLDDDGRTNYSETDLIERFP